MQNETSNVEIMELLTPELSKVLIASITAFFTSVTAVAVAVVSKRSELKQKEIAKIASDEAEKKKKDVEKYKAEAFQVKKDFAKLLVIWGKTIGDIDRLIDETEIDRFLMLTAINGIEHPRETTAHFQKREEGQKKYEYEEIQIDDHYRNLLKQTIQDGFVYFIVDELPDGVLIKNIYMMEGVKSSMWIFICVNDFGNGKKSITYASLSTHQDGGISASTQTRCLITRDLLAGASNIL